MPDQTDGDSGNETDEVGRLTVLLRGGWQKQTDDPCAAAYPDRFTVGEFGIYQGSKGAPGDGEFTIWDAGRCEVLDAGRARISTANDREITYQFNLSGDELRFTDENGCRFTFRRTEAA